MPETRERRLSSTKRTIIASVNGMAPKIVAMKRNCTAWKAQPSSFGQTPSQFFAEA